MAETQEIPCIPFPRPKKPLEINLPFGSKLQAITDMSQGPPTDCALVHGLMLQLAPTLAGMTCFFRMLSVIKALKDLSLNPDSVKNVATKAAELAECFNVFIKIPKMIVDILRLIIAYLQCIIGALTSLLNFRMGIDLQSAEGNPVLKASFDCALNNADASFDQIKQALEVIQPLLDMISNLMGMAAAGLPDPAGKALKIIPDVLSAIGPIVENGGASVGVPGSENFQNILQTLNDLKSTLEQVDEALQSLP